MSKTSEIDKAAALLEEKGMDKGMAYKNLLECDRYFIDRLIQIL